MNIIKTLSALLRQNNMDAVLITDNVALAYVTGMSNIEGTAFITKDEKAFCFTDSRYIEAAQNIVPPRGFAVSTVEGNNYFKHISQMCKDLGVKALGFEDAYMTVQQYKRAEAVFDHLQLVDASGILQELRTHKSDFEVNSIKRAQKIAEEALDILLGEIKPGDTEKACKARLEYLMSVKGSEMPSFDTIFITGKKTSMPHGVSGDNIIEKGDFITIDFGATINGYKSDMTRTVAVGGVSDEMKKVYDTVLCAQLAAIEKAVVGTPLKDVDSAARDIIKNAGYGQYFGHGTGHGVGLEIHEAPTVSPRSSVNAANGQVITIEPGIYIPETFGVRIEDMLYFVDDNRVNLTNYPKNLIIL
ncbi:MAG: aminopeptidase P family protein [Clostridia bacterium]|nr:aminopeptidase P family protein [Clostridia bacterium]